jgi:hypothetical protein
MASGVSKDKRERLHPDELAVFAMIEASKVPVTDEERKIVIEYLTYARGSEWKSVGTAIANLRRKRLSPRQRTKAVFIDLWRQGRVQFRIDGTNELVRLITKHELRRGRDGHQDSSTPKPDPRTPDTLYQVWAKEDIESTDKPIAFCESFGAARSVCEYLRTDPKVEGTWPEREFGWMPIKTPEEMKIAEVLASRARNSDFGNFYRVTAVIAQAVLEKLLPDASIREESFELGGVAQDARSIQTKAGSKTEQALLEVESWSDLAIGINEDGSFLAVTPVPNTGTVFPKEKAVALPLKGARWKKLLQLIARSKDGQSSRKDELLHDFGYYTKPVKEEEIKRAHKEMLSEIDVAAKKLTGAVSDLSRELREYIGAADSSRTNPPLSAADQSVIKAGFTCRHLLRGRDGKLRFGSIGNG